MTGRRVAVGALLAGGMRGQGFGGVRFRWAPAGTFLMGSPAGEAQRRADEGPVRVELTRGFWVGPY